VSIQRSVIYIAKKLESSLPHLGLTPHQIDVLDVYVDALQAAVMASGWSEGSGNLSAWSPVDKRLNGLPSYHGVESNGDRKISLEK
jgi:hypothetical protein